MTFTRLLRRSALLLAAVPFFGLATGALFPLVALSLEGAQATAGFIGTVTSLYYAGSFLGAVTFGAVVSRAGFRVSFAIAALTAALAAYGLMLTDDTTAWLCLRFAGGYALGAYYIVLDSWFQALGGRATRGKLYAIYETVRLAATALGPFLLVVGPLQSSLLLAALAYLVSILPAVLNPPPDGASQKDYSLAGAVAVARCFPFALLIVFCGGVSSASFYGLSAVYAVGIGLDHVAIAFFVAFVLLAPAFSELPLGAASDRMKRMSVAGACGLAALAACVALSVVEAPPLWAACLGGAIVGACMVPMYAFGISRVVDALGEGSAVAAATAGLFAYNLGALSGPALAGAAMEILGPAGLYLFLGAIASTAAIAAVSDLFASRCCPERVPGA